MQSNHSTQTSQPDRIPSEAEFKEIAEKAVELNKSVNYWQLYRDLMRETVRLYWYTNWARVKGRSVEGEEVVKAQGIFWVLIESFKIIGVRAGLIIGITLALLLTTVVTITSPVLNLIALPFSRHMINKAQEEADKEAAAEDSAVRAKVDEALGKTA